MKQAAADTVIFHINGQPLERVRSFRYLGRILSDNDDDSPCIQENLRRARQRWNCIAKILKAEGANAKCMSKFYMTIVQAVLLYGADTWVIKKQDMDRLRSFHKRALRYMTGEHIRQKGDNTWEYPDHQDLLKKCSLFPIETYIQRRRGTLRRYMDDCRSELLDKTKLCPRHSRDAHKLVWWEQEYII